VISVDRLRRCPEYIRSAQPDVGQQMVVKVSHFADRLFVLDGAGQAWHWNSDAPEMDVHDVPPSGIYSLCLAISK